MLCPTGLVEHSLYSMLSIFNESYMYRIAILNSSENYDLKNLREFIY